MSIAIKTRHCDVTMLVEADWRQRVADGLVQTFADLPMATFQYTNPATAERETAWLILNNPASHNSCDVDHERASQVLKTKISMELDARFNDEAVASFNCDLGSATQTLVSLSIKREERAPTTWAPGNNISLIMNAVASTINITVNSPYNVVAVTLSDRPPVEQQPINFSSHWGAPNPFLIQADIGIGQKRAALNGHVQVNALTVLKLDAVFQPDHLMKLVTELLEGTDVIVVHSVWPATVG